MMQFGEFARERLEAALSGLAGDAVDSVVISDVELALMALYKHFGSSTAMITLHPEDVVEHLDPPERECICPPGLVARGGFRSGCPAHHSS